MNTKNTKSRTAEAQLTPTKPSEALHHRVAEQLGMKIVTGQFADDKWLPPEPAMAERLGISRTALRTALVVLNQKRLITIHHGKGARVTAADSWDLLDIDVLRWLAQARSMPASQLPPATGRLVEAAAELAQLVDKIAAQTPDNPLVTSLLRRLRPITGATHADEEA